LRASFRFNRVNNCWLLAEMALSAVCKIPQEPAQTRGSRKKKANRLGLAFKVLVELASIE
jgi:hypothetical protein